MFPPLRWGGYDIHTFDYGDSSPLPSDAAEQDATPADGKAGDKQHEWDQVAR